MLLACSHWPGSLLAVGSAAGLGGAHCMHASVCAWRGMVWLLRLHTGGLCYLHGGTGCSRGLKYASCLHVGRPYMLKSAHGDTNKVVFLRHAMPIDAPCLLCLSLAPV